MLKGRYATVHEYLYIFKFFQIYLFQTKLFDFILVSDITLGYDTQLVDVNENSS